MSNLVCHKTTIILIADLVLTVPPDEQARGDAITKGLPEPMPVQLKLPAGTIMEVRAVSKIEPRTVQVEFDAELSAGPEARFVRRFGISLPLSLVKEITRPKLIPKAGKLVTARPS